MWRINNEKIVALKNRDSQLSGTVTAVFEDREGNLWLGTSRGLGRLREGAFTTFSDTEGLSSDNNGPIFVDSGERTWFAPSSGGIYFFSDNRVKKIAVQGLDKDIVYSIDGSEKDIWIGRQTGGLTHLLLRDGEIFSAKTYTERDGLIQNNVFAVHLARDGSLWAGTLSAGVSRLKDGVFKTFTTADGLAINTVTAMAESPDGTMWFATPGGLSSYDGKSWRTFKRETGLPSDIINALTVDSTGTLWIGTEKGITFMRSEKIQTPANLFRSLSENIYGIAEDRNGALWIATASRIIQVNRDKLLNNALLDIDIREFGIADGLKSVKGNKRSRSVVSDVDGRIWFSLERGISMIEPNRLNKLSAAALVSIRALSAGSLALNLREPVSIVSSNENIKISYQAMSLSIPERISYRYKLDGFDSDWSEPTAATERVYSNLSPGIYTFRVISTNSEGLWKSSEASIEFQIVPRVWQTRWFQCLAVLMVLLIIAALFRLRIYQVKRQLNRRFEERLAERLGERQRIAHDLHDTLLQGVYSASIQLDFIVEELAENSSHKPTLQRVLQLMGQVMEEGRNTLNGLNSVTTDKLYALEDSFFQIKHDFDRREQVDFRIKIKGNAQPLRPVVRDEIYRIGREAIINAFRHSKATRIETELEYASRFFKLTIQDDGIGIAPNWLRNGRDGHFGISGMKDCAERIDAELTITNLSSGSEGGGAIVELFVPGQFAYENQTAGNLFDWRSILLLPGRNDSARSDSDKKKKINGK